MKIERNAKCPCGSGKKYKHCCMRQDIENARQEVKETEVKYEELPEPKFATWKIFGLGVVGLVLIWVLFWLAFGVPQVGSAIFVLGLVGLIFYCAFRNPPTVRERPGDGGNIDFGNRA